MDILLAVLAFVAVAGLVLVFGGQGDAKASKRAKELSSGRTRRSTKDLGAEAAAKRRASVQASLKDLVRNQQSKRRNLLAVKARLEQANVPISESMFWMACLAFGAAAGLGVFVWSKGNPIFAVIAGFISAFGLPRWVLGFLIGRRQKMFSSQLADALDVIVRGVKSGLPLNQCLRIIATEAPEPLRTEFSHVVDGQAMGVGLDQNLQRLYERVPLPEVNFFNIVLVIQQKTGGNLSESLGNLSAVLRARKLMREKVKALSSEAKASAMIIGSLPFAVMIMVHLTRPDYMAVLFTDPRGQLILLGCALMMGTGIYIMRSMINFKF